jgi:protein-disulfide isomerase
MHDLLFENQRRLHSDDILRYADAIRVNRDAFVTEVDHGRCRARIEEHLRSGVESGVNGTPTFFINGVRYDGLLDFDHLARSIRSAGSINSAGAL